MSWTPFGAAHPAPAAHHTAALTHTPEGPLMAQFGAYDLLVWRWTGTAWTLGRRVLTRREGYPWEDGRPNGGALVAYYDEAAGTPVVGYVERSGEATLAPLDGTGPIVIADSYQYGGATAAVLDPATRGVLLSDGSHTSVVRAGDTVELHVADHPSASLDTLAADPSASRVVGLDWHAATHAWTGAGWRELAPPPGGAKAFLPHSTLAYCPTRKRVLCLFADAAGRTMELHTLEHDRWVAHTPRVVLPGVAQGALLGVGEGGSLVLFGGQGDEMSAATWVSDGDGGFRRVVGALELPRGRATSPVALDGRLAVLRRDALSVRLLDADRLGDWVRLPVRDGVRLRGSDANVVADRTGLWLLDGEGTLWHEEHRGDGPVATAHQDDGPVATAHWGDEPVTAATSGEGPGESFGQRFRRMAPADGGPGPRATGRAALVLDRGGDRLLVIGGDRRRTTERGRGVTAAARRNDTWVFTPGHGRWERLETEGAPPDRDGAAAATPHGVHLFVSGELWRLAGATWSRVAAAPEGYDDGSAHWLWYDARRHTLLAATLGGAADTGTVWALAGGRFRPVATVPREATAPVLNRAGFLAMDPAEDRLVVVLSGEQHLMLPLEPALAGIAPAELALPVPPVADPVPVAPSGAGRRLPAFDPPLGHREWAELRRRMLLLGEQVLGVDLARRLVRSRVLLSHPTDPSSTGPAGGRTRCGGNPRLAPGTPWPTVGNRPLSLLAVLDCAELAAVGVHERLPTDGYLNVFYDPGANPAAHAFPDPDHPALDTAPDLGWRVVHAGADAVEALPPDGATVYRERVMCRTHTLPWTGVDGLEPPDVDPPITDLRAAWEDLGAPPGPSFPTGGDGPAHVVGGWPIWLQNPLWDTPDWRLLLQLDSDDELGWCWGDAGRLYFGIPERDLETGTFDRVWVVSESC